MAATYKLVKAPKEYGGRFHGPPGWAYEHHVVWGQYTGNRVPDGHLIHHKDENSRNNRIENLVVMTFRGHARHHNATGRTLVRLTCPTCRDLFVRERRQTHLVKKGNKATYCSRRCVGLRVVRDLLPENRRTIGVRRRAALTYLQQ